MLDNGSNLHVNEHQKIRTITVGLLKKKKEYQITIFYFARRAHKVRYYTDVNTHSWKSTVEHDGVV